MPSSVISANSELLFWLLAAVVVIAQLAVVRAAFTGRTPGTSASKATRIRELVWVLLPAAVLITVLLWTWTSLPAAHITSGPGMGNIGLAYFSAVSVGS